MPDASERLVNLALFLAASRAPITAQDCREEVFGYPEDQDDAAFARMFERDKDTLRGAGLVIEVALGDDDTEAYLLDRAATFARPLSLDAAAARLLQATGTALAADPSFPFGRDLALALAKLSPSLEASGTPSASLLAPEDALAQGERVASLADAAARGKQVRFGYTNAAGQQRAHAVEGYGLFLREGRWYLVARDIDLDEVRVYAAARVRELAVDASRPKTPDYAAPEDFELSEYLRLPFQYGDEALDAVLRFDAASAWRAPALSEGVGTLEGEADGGLLWHVGARDGRRLLRWVVENGPGIAVESPEDLVTALSAGLERVVSAHDA